MTDLWFQCETCIFGSNSKKQAAVHQENTTHAIRVEEIEDE